MQKMLIDYSTLDALACKPCQAQDVSFLSINSLHSEYRPLCLRSYQLLQYIFRIFSPAAIFTHAANIDYLFMHASLGISLKNTLEYVDISNTIYLANSLTRGTLDDGKSYMGAPICNTDGNVIAVTAMLCTGKDTWHTEEVAFFRAVIPYIEYHVSQIDGRG